MSDQVYDLAKQRVEETLGTVDNFLSGTKSKDHAKLKEKYQGKINDEYKRVLKEQDRERKQLKEKIKLSNSARKQDKNNEKLFPVRDVILQTSKGYAELRKVQPETGEMLLDPDNDETIYTGIHPAILQIHNDIFPTRLARLLLKKRFRVRMHYQLWDQPFTKDAYTGEILDQGKKQRVLRERGIIDEQGFFLKENGDRYEVDSCYIKYDVSDIDFIKSEFLAFKKSETVDQVAAAQKKTGAGKQPAWYWLIPILSIISNIFIVAIYTFG